ncbi:MULTISPECIES: hypothetical protein [Sphingomonas]|uniref:Uncharacterized protein n=1 Tax=Sphingomonas leidyi TaxID=68569 RepID=A0A7X5ZWN2_9SPHN|nr:MULTISPECIES: hypothetical protein [Sphingomonas]MBN8811023.1 hypothetical protein [Sphingomonas sp.]NIJ66326.1 hypothetical protein [Sphingomonas leidyi]OJY54515.1 MAG: hypothetical protein BGP17_05635 [Sphingomonas sp. 67-41]
MKDWLTLGIEMQRDLIQAQQAQMAAAQKMLDAGRDVMKLQQAGQRAAEANLAAWRQWSSMWGWK